MFCGWEMGEHIHVEILKALKMIVTGTWYLSISSNEMTSINNQQWLLVHVYVVNN
jgi:hypothetical protein